MSNEVTSFPRLFEMKMYNGKGFKEILDFDFFSDSEVANTIFNVDSTDSDLRIYYFDALSYHLIPKMFSVVKSMHLVKEKDNYFIFCNAVLRNDHIRSTDEFFNSVMPNMNSTSIVNNNYHILRMVDTVIKAVGKNKLKLARKNNFIVYSATKFKYEFNPIASPSFIQCKSYSFKSLAEFEDSIDKFSYIYSVDYHNNRQDEKYNVVGYINENE